jgi:F-type H+-transporting ATPase subunit alpha
MLRIKHQADVIDVLASGSINNEVTDIIEQVAAEAVKALKK